MEIIRQLIPDPIRRRYVVKFGIALLILGLSVGAIGFVATAAITDEVEQRVQDEHGTAVQQEAQSLQMWHEQNERTAAMIATTDVVASGEVDRIEANLADWRRDHPTEVFEISYVDTEDGEVAASSANRYRGESSDVLGVPDRAYDEATTDSAWVSEPYLAEDHLGDESPVVSYVLAVPDQDDRAIVYTAELRAYMNTIYVGDHVTMMILDGDDEVMVDSARLGEDRETFGLEYGDDEALSTARSAGEYTAVVDRSPTGALADDAYEFDDEEYVVSAAPVHGTDWVVVAHEPTAEAYGFVNAVDQNGTYATLLGVLLIGLVGAVLGRNTAVSIDRLTDKAGKMEKGDLDVDLETQRIDSIGRLYQGFDSMRVALREQIEEAEAAREEAERERERVQEINDHLEEKAAEYSDVMEAAADGDLTARMDADGENEAMAEIAADFNQMLEELEATVAELNRFATEVATASEQVTASSEEVRSASKQVAGSIQEISDGAERQNESLQSVNQEMSALSTTTEEIAASSNEVADIAEQTAETGREGQDAARGAIDAMGEIETEAEGAVAEIRRLESEVQQIDELIAKISEIAQQTNMLALNANIEASRSANAEEDEGFAVVAQEVKALSQDVADAADEAEERLETIRERTEQSAAEVEGTSDRIDVASEQVQRAVDSLEEIADLASETNVGVQEISAATEEQAASTQEVVAMVDDAATISEETTVEAENVAAAAEEQTTALTEVTDSASTLSQQAAELSEALDRFDTDADVDAATANGDEGRETAEERAIDSRGTAAVDRPAGGSATDDEADESSDSGDDADDVFTFDTAEETE